jgi:uncharacterized protein YcbX
MNTNGRVGERIGAVEALFRYPVKSMRGERLESIALGWHGLEGDRRVAIRRVDDRGGFPWLTAGRLPDLVRFSPARRGPDAEGDLPTHVRTPEGEEMPLFSPELAAAIGRRHGSPVEMTHLNRGIFDEASVSMIATATVDEIGRLATQPPDVRRFRPNILIASLGAAPFAEEGWVGGILSFGEGSEAAAVGVTNRDDRCAMVNLDPDSPRTDAEVLKAIVRVKDNKAGVYGTVLRRGRLAVGQPIFFEPDAAGSQRRTPGVT